VPRMEFIPAPAPARFARFIPAVDPTNPGDCPVGADNDPMCEPGSATVIPPLDVLADRPRDREFSLVDADTPFDFTLPPVACVRERAVLARPVTAFATGADCC
jgi:hypothetical protein